MADTEPTESELMAMHKDDWKKWWKRRMRNTYRRTGPKVFDMYAERAYQQFFLRKLMSA